jgi:hypothetical protein
MSPWFSTLTTISEPSFEAIHWLFLAALVYATLSVLIAGTLFDHSGFFRLVNRFGITPFLLFLVGPVVFSTRRARDPACRACRMGSLANSGSSRCSRRPGPRRWCGHATSRT